MTTRELVLQPILTAVQQSVSDYVLADAQWHTHIEHMSQHMMVQLRKHVLSERLQGDVTVPVFVPLALPHRRSLWQWFWGRPKVRAVTLYRRVTIPVASYNTFPEAQVRYPDELGRPVRLQMWEEPEPA